MTLPAALSELARQSAWGSRIVLWIGALDVLTDGLKHATHHVLDLLDVCDDDLPPRPDDEDVRDALRDGLQAKLLQLRADHDRLVLIVRSVPLFARYKLGFSELYDYFCGDSHLVILALERPLPTNQGFSDEFRYRPTRLSEYFSETQVESVFREGEP